MTNMLYGEKLKQELKKILKREQDDLARMQDDLDNFRMEWSDCFRSYNVSQASVKCTLAQLRIMDTDGTQEFTAVKDKKTGEILNSRHVNTPYGWKYVIDIPGRKSVFVNNFSPRCLNKHGLEKTTVRRPVWVKLSGDNLGNSWETYYEAKFNRVTGELLE